MDRKEFKAEIVETATAFENDLRLVMQTSVGRCGMPLCTIEHTFRGVFVEKRQSNALGEDQWMIVTPEDDPELYAHAMGDFVAKLALKAGVLPDWFPMEWDLREPIADHESN
jgi:hypothetical protein